MTLIVIDMLDSFNRPLAGSMWATKLNAPLTVDGPVFTTETTGHHFGHGSTPALDPSGATDAYRLLLTGASVGMPADVYTVQVPDVESITISDLILNHSVDPATLVPTDPEAVAAWVAMLQDVTDTLTHVVTGGSVNASGDLTLTTPAGDSIAAGNVKGPKGDKGDPGDLTPAPALANWSGSIAVHGSAPGTFDALLTGDVSITLPAGAPGVAYSVTLILEQDAVGSRKVTWPSNLKWPEAAPVALTATPGAVDVIDLLWTGARWLGVLGGFSFA